ncbi:MAG: hypothetical protein JWP27_2292 [Flaviaesturariibacter sp.]|nr:hypothetical protein [Flaviaesturariibacter sp.]
MENRRQKIEGFLLIVFAWCCALALAYIAWVRLHIFLFHSA